MDAQHCQQNERWPACATFRVVGRNEFNQSSPWHHLVHLFQEHLLSGFLEAETEIQDCLFHGPYFLKQGLHQAHKSMSFAEFP